MVTSVSRAAAGTTVAVCLAGALVAPAAAQSLSLSYKLDPVHSPQTPKSSPLVNRCAGLTWAATLAAACIAETAASKVVTAVAALRAETAAPDATPESGVSARRAESPATYAAAEAASRRYELPNLGSPVEARVIRAAGGRSEYIGNARNVDVNFRFGSKYRMRSGEEGLEVYKFQDANRFVDPNTDKRLHGGAKQVGIELLVPFQ